MNKVVIIVQARMSSKRLPGKVLKEVMGRPLLSYQLERLKRVKRADEVVVATTTSARDDSIADWCKREAVPFFRGSEEDVLMRYIEAARAFEADVVVRITADCPLIDPVVVDRVIAYYLEHCDQFDYVSNCLERTYPKGMDTEVVSRALLEQVEKVATKNEEREHVTWAFYHTPGKYRAGCLRYETDTSEHVFCVDTEEEFEKIQGILKRLYPEKPQFTLEDLLEGNRA